MSRNRAGTNVALITRVLVRLVFALALALSVAWPEVATAQRVKPARQSKRVRAKKNTRHRQSPRVRTPRSTRRVKTTRPGLRNQRSSKNWARRKKRKANKTKPRMTNRMRRRRLTVTRDPDAERLRRKSPSSRERARKPLKLKIRNRGRLATLKGIRKGKRYTLVNPTTGKVDTRAKVVSTGTDKWSKVPFAKVEFSNGHIAKYAAERLNLVGKSRAYQKKYIRAQRKALFAAIEKQLGEPVKDVKLKTLRGRNVQPRKRRLTSGKWAKPHLGPFIVALGEKLEPREGLLGYQVDGKATVSRHHAAFDIATPTHEVLHGMSQKFIDQMFDKKLVNTLEGITDYFTFKVVRPHYGVQQKPSDAYRTYTLFAEQIASKIGDDKLKKIFFGKRGDLVKRLSTAVDTKVGKKGAFMRAARALEKGKLVSFDE